MKEMNRKEFLKLAVKGTAAAAVLSALPSTLTAYADEGEKLYIPGTYSAEAPGKEKVKSRMYRWMYLPRPRKSAASTVKHFAHSFWKNSLPTSMVSLAQR